MKRKVGLAGALGVAIALTGCSLIAELADERFEPAFADASTMTVVSNDATAKSEGSEAGRANDASAKKEDDGGDAAPAPGGWVADESFPAVVVTEDAVPGSLLENFFYLAVSPTKVWLVGNEVDVGGNDEGLLAIPIDKSSARAEAAASLVSNDQVQGAAATSSELFIAAVDEGDDDDDDG